ncbi:MAG TPA: hypothetical protein VNL71_20100 [Chloroflexota bacterium]|nr:hypothetical protein [Chloroflexota bacterium]
MQMLAVPLQTETRPDEGLALTWFEVPGAIRYGLIIGVPGVPMPDLDIIMRGQTQHFAIVGVPSRFTGAVDIGTPTGETRQFGMVAYRNDGEILAVPSLQIHAARSAPRDREYHAVVPPALVDPNPAPPTPQEADPNDPWSALEAANASGSAGAVAAAASAPPVIAPSFTVPSSPASDPTPRSAAPYDPWDVLSHPEVAESAPPPSSPEPISAARYEAVAAQLPVEPATRHETPATAVPDEPAPGPEPLAAGSPAEHAADLVFSTAAPPASAVPHSEAAEPTVATPEAKTEPEAPVGSLTEFANEGVVTPPVDHAAYVSEDADRPEDALAPPVSERVEQRQDSESPTATDLEATESPAAEVTPPATWERGFTTPPETAPPIPAPQVEEPTPLLAAEPVPSSPPPAPAAPPPPPLPAELAALLDEAELYLLPQWADQEAALRLLEQAEREAPEHPRVRDVRARLEAMQGGGDSAQIAGLLEQATRSLSDRDYWAAVDHYEQILAEQPEHEGALAGLAQARLRARWPTQLAGASGDSTALRALGDDAIAEAPDLAGQAYAAAFAIQPGVDVLRGWLLAFVRAGHGEVLAGTARRAVRVLEERGKIRPVPEVAPALDELEQATSGDPSSTELAVNHLCDLLGNAAP